MADKRVQLQDKDGNNIFPVAFGTGEAAVQTVNLADSAVTVAKVADGAITTAKIADGAVTSDKIDSASLRNAIILESDTQTVTIDANKVQTLPMYGIFRNWAKLISGKIIVGCLFVPTGVSSGRYLDYHFQGIGGNLDQYSYGVSIINTDSTAHTWTYKIIITMI